MIVMIGIGFGRGEIKGLIHSDISQKKRDHIVSSVRRLAVSPYLPLALGK